VAKFCDRSPCAGMIEALGRWIVGDTKGGYIALTAAKGGKGACTDEIEYCPFCGTHLDQLSLSAKGPIQVVRD
jgi:hypothetical protein